MNPQESILYVFIFLLFYEFFKKNRKLKKLNSGINF